MKKITLSIILSLFINVLFSREYDSLLIATKIEFDKGKKEFNFIKDTTIKKHNGVIKIRGCNSLKDIKDNENFREYEYIGDIKNNSFLKIIQQLLYNGEAYIIVDVKHKCRNIQLLGRPHVYNSNIINFNESETTDKKKIIEVWRIIKGAIYKKKNIIYKRNLEFVDIRFSLNGNVVLKDIEGKYWKFCM